MLYDFKRWEKPDIKADPFSLESLIAWLERQPADETYNWHDCGGQCLIGLYLAAQGYAWGNSEHYQRFTNYQMRIQVAGQEPFTYGAALERARNARTS